MLSGLHCPIATESATFSIRVINSSTVEQNVVNHMEFLQCEDVVNLLVCNSYADAWWVFDNRLILDFNGRGASKFFKVRPTCDIVMDSRWVPATVENVCVQFVVLIAFYEFSLYLLFFSLFASVYVMCCFSRDNLITMWFVRRKCVVCLLNNICFYA